MTAQAIALRKADVGASALLAALHAKAFAKPWPEAAFARLLGSPGVIALLAHAHAPCSEALGFALLRHAAEEAEILTFCVVPEARGKGVGRRLLEGALDTLRAGGVRSVCLEVGLSNRPARRLYERAGFAEIGKRHGYYREPEGSDEDALVLLRALP